MNWNFRVIERVKDRADGCVDVSYSIHEVYYKDGAPDMWSVTPQAPYGETLEELREDIERMARAIEKPTLKWDEMPGNR